MISVLFLVLGVLALLILIAWIRDIRRFVVIPYQIASSKIKREVKIVVLSDLHNKRYGSENECLVTEIIKQNPDFIVVAGDMITAGQTLDANVPLELLKKLSTTYRIYYANGNHEQKIKRLTQTYGSAFLQYKKELEANKIVFLENESVYLPEYNITLSGLEIEKKYFKRMKTLDMPMEDITRAVGRSQKESFHMLLAHNPDYFACYADWGADLTISGHIHGGVMRLPLLGGVISPSFHLFPKYDGGMFERNGKKMILGRGLGTHTIPVRIFNPGELVVITLKNQKVSEEEN